MSGQRESRLHSEAAIPEKQAGRPSPTLPKPADNGHADKPQVPTNLYKASPVERKRATNAELGVIDDAIMTVLTEENPATLRGVFYRVMSAGAVDKTEVGYQQVGRQVLKLRRAGHLPYKWIVDGTRSVRAAGGWRDMNEALSFVSRSYRRNPWQDQPVDVLVLSEKDALVGVIERVTDEWQCPLGVLRGYASESFVWSVAKGLPLDKPTHLLQLGDHDPSGVDAWRDFEEKVQAFAPDAPLRFERLAVTPEQIEELALPKRPTNKKDTRSGEFVGDSVEVDAIAPNGLRQILHDGIEERSDKAALEATREVERSERDRLKSLIGGAR